MNEKAKDLLLFFHRPTEPCFMPKGVEWAAFEVPGSYYPEKYKHIKETIANRFANEADRMIPVREIALPNLSLPMELPYNAQFSLWVPKHRIMAAKLIEIFMKMHDLEDLKSLCAYCQLHINPYMFNYCLSVALLHRPDTKALNIPTFSQTFPDKFMDPKVFRRAREVSNVVPNGSRKPIVLNVNYTASDKEPEQRVAYFREDIGVSLHHWHWHLVYPYESDFEIVNKDRRGELFYYMHQQIIARYNAERYSNGLSRVRSYSDFRQPIEEAYFPKLDSRVAGRIWPPRFANSMVHDVDRPVDLARLDISTLETWRERFIQAIETLSIYLPDGTRVPLDEEVGIDILGNMMESTIISPNREYYGNYHNLGHLIISCVHDPDHRHLEPYGLMVDSSVTMRDPVFFRWHSHIDELFQLYKYNLSPYPDDKLEFPGIHVARITVEGPAGNNTFSTHWQESTVELSRGMDFTPRGSVLAKYTHLQHEEFTYVIEVNNTSGQGVKGTVRIFMASMYNEQGQALPFDELRRSMIEMDRFTTTLNTGNSTIRQKSVDSSVTIPFERTFADQASRPAEPGAPASAEFDFCRCGWPHHMLLPKGTAQGLPVVLFVMISNWTDDRIEQDEIGSCNDASSYCGIRDRRYPDRRNMGFPFDRPIPLKSLDEFLKPNMNVTQCKIRFNDVTLPKQR